MSVNQDVTALLDGFAVEITGKDDAAIARAKDLLPAGTRVNVTFLVDETAEMRRDTARAVRDNGFVPVAHLAARRFSSVDELDAFLGDLREDGNADAVFVVGGDPSAALGPFEDAAELIESGRLQEFGVSEVGIAGYPTGHALISDDALWAALDRKAAALRDNGLQGTIITQFAFDADRVVAWVGEVRARGIDLPIRIGIPGPAKVSTVMMLAGMFGVAPTPDVALRYGFSVDAPDDRTAPDRFIVRLVEALGPEHGDVSVHFYTFGGLSTTARWIRDFQEQQASSSLSR